jgi:uncharacterized protein (DUF1778 family)
MSAGSTLAHIDLQLEPSKKEVITRAAAALGIAVEDFIIGRALPEAERIVAEDGQTRLSKEDWDKFVAKLDEPPRDLPELRRLMREPSIFVKG